jgi:RNA polymerase sigma-70 factor (ECF subfamily)
MARIALADQGAFRLLARRYAGRAAGLSLRVTGNAADAEEIAQEALLRVWVNAPAWRPTAAFRTWFYRVVLNLCLNRRRRKPFLPLDQAGDPADPAADPHMEVERSETDRRIAAAIAELPERQRAAIVLTYQEELSNADAAAALETTVSGIETLLVRARRALRDKLATIRDD